MTCDTTAIGVQLRRQCQTSLGPLLTMAAGANSAIDSNLGCPPRVKAQLLGITDGFSMFHVAANRNRQLVVLVVTGCDGPINRAGKN